MKTRKRVHLVRTVSIVMAAIMSLGIFVLPSFANSGTITGSNFEGVDGDTDAGNHTDWNTVALNDQIEQAGGQSQITVQGDKASGSGDDSFGGGAKEDSPVPTVVDGSIPPNKSDLKEFGAYKEENSSGKYLHLFWTRVQDPSGTTNMDFELNQKACVAGGLDRTGCSSNGVTPTRTAGDLLITYDLSNGGSVASISLRRWTAAGWGPATGLDVNVASGSINAGPVTLTKTGNTYSTRTFGEASIDLNQIFTSQTCQTFGSAYLKSRSSDSFTAALKDFIAPTAINLTNCGRLVIHKRSSGNLLAGAGFTINPPSQATPSVSVMSQPATGVFCIDNLTLGASYTVTETTVPAGYGGAAPQPLTVTDASGCSGVSATNPTVPDATFVNNRLQGYIDIVKTDDTTPTALPVGGATFTAYVDANPSTGTNSTTARGPEDTVVGSSCQTDVTGVCSTAAMNTGWYWVVETAPTGYTAAADQRVNVAADGQHYTLNFVNARKFTVITLVCNEGTNKLYPSSVVFDGETKRSLAPGSLSDAAQADLCALTGARFTGKAASATPRSGNVTIGTAPAPAP